MRKFPYLAMVVAALLCSCSDGDDSGSTDYSSSSVEATQLVPIQLGIQNSNSVFVRGTGTVGDTLGSVKNIWQAQRLKVYMLHKDSIGLVKDLQGKSIYDNVEFYAPGMVETDGNHGGLFTGITDAANDSTIRPLNDTVKYYPLNGNFDFYGYRLDGADTAAVNFNVDNDITVGFKINGTQDIMVAKAVPSATDITKLGTGPQRYFSSYAARRGVHPNLKFRHLLTRLSFNVIPCGPKTVDTNTYIVVDSIRLIAANTKGTLTIARDGDVEGNSQVIAWEGSTLDNGDTLSLMQRSKTYVGNLLDSLNLVELDTVALKDSVYWADVPDGTTIKGTNTNKLDSATVHIGEAMLLAPATEYKMIMYVRQKLPVTYSGGTASAAWQYNKLESTIKFNSPTSTGFQAGKTYDVKAKIYSIEEIIITASLTGWDQGDDVHIDTEDEP